MKDLQARQAIFTGITSLYHYQSFDKGSKDEDYLRQTLVDNTIYCSNPNDFEDLWDMKPVFPKLTENSFLRKGIEKQLRGLDFDESIISSVDNIQEIYENISYSQGIAYAELFRVYCLTLRNNNIEMWERYANVHKGICLEFDINNEIFGSAWQVDYNDESAYFSVLIRNEPMLFVLRKKTSLIVEEEFRILAKTELANKNGEFNNLCVNNENKLKIPGGALKSIIVGCQGDYEYIKYFVHSINANIQLKKAVKNKNKINLIIV
ncbi:hypothetical protein A6J63_012160 [Yersinia enterocolitica]|nr:hypothetical protein A6J63_012160 [Yersinia enterocolitica]HDL7837461.1 hypothetical protein [Yersinia enterocolitica]